MQNIFKNLTRLFLGPASGAGGGDPDGLYYYVKCDRCGEVVQVRLNRNNDLSVEYGEGGEKSDVLQAHKLIVGQKCPNRMEADFIFDRNRSLVQKNVTAGKFVDALEYKVNQDVG